MSHNVLITGASGYLGGSLLANWKEANLPPYAHLYALVRTEEQAQAVQQYGAEPLVIDLNNHEAIANSIVQKQITIIFFLIDAGTARHQPTMIEALGTVKKQTGKDVHFLHTSGAKMFSRHVGISTDQPLPDTHPDMYDILSKANSPYKAMLEAAQVNNDIIEIADAHDVRSYIFAPCAVYGRGEGFGNKISIQDVAIVKLAQKMGRVYSVDSDKPSWPVCHINDNSTLYLQILRKILSGEDIGYGKQGFYLAASGSIAWDDIYQAIAKALVKRKVIADDSIEMADAAVLAKMGEALGVPPGIIPVQIGGKCTLTAEHGRKIGWTPQYPPEHILEAADDEVELILDELRKG